MVSAGNKAESLSSVNHTTKTIHHHHHNVLITQSALTEFSVGGFKSPSDQLSIATSKNSSVVNIIWICSFPLNSCDYLKPEYNFYKLRHIVR